MKSVNCWFGIILFTLSNIYAAKPEWVKSCGISAQYASNRYFTGFGVSSVNDSDLKSKMESAKRMAYLSLTESVRLRIVSSQSASIELPSNHNWSTNEVYKSKVAVSSLMDLRGVTVHFYDDRWQKCVYALAVMDRKKAGDYYIKQIQSLRFQLQRVDTAEWEKNSNLLLDAVKMFAQIKEYRLFADVTEAPNCDTFNYCTLDFYEKKVKMLLDKESFSIDELVSKLIGKIYERMMPEYGKVFVAPFYERGTDELSTLGSRVSRLVENKISSFTFLEPIERSEEVILTENAAVFEAKRCGADYLISGTYSTGSTKQLIFELQLVNVISGTVLESFQAVLVSNLPVENALVNKSGSKSTLEIEIETGRGKDNLVFEEGEVFRIYIKVNKPCYLLLIHSLPDGLMAIPELVYQNYYIELSDVNKFFGLPDTFTVTPPFGEESISFYVSENPFPQLQIVNRIIDGQIYRIVTGEVRYGMDRGVKVQFCAQVIKKVLKITTVSRK